MTAVHVYTALWHPLTRYPLDLASRRYWIKNKPNALAYCHNCRKQRRARNLKVQVYYDCTIVRCADVECRPAKRKGKRT